VRGLQKPVHALLYKIRFREVLGYLHSQVGSAARAPFTQRAT
jgi:hypothetical protein